MTEDKNDVLPDIVTPISNSVKQNLPNTMQQTDGVLSTVIGFINNVILYPIKIANLNFRFKLEAFEKDIRKKAKNIPDENLQIPPLMIAGPALEALRYTYDEKALREMYENLLVSAIDNRLASKIHPSFIEVIKQMSPLDAIILEKVYDYWDLRCVNFTFKIKKTNKIFFEAMPNYFVEELADLADPFIVSTSLVNLERLGIIKISEGILQGEDYESIKAHPYVEARKDLYKKIEKDFFIYAINYYLKITDYGTQFAKVCLEKNL